MNNKVISVLAFSVGAAVGSVATWLIVKTKYEKMAQEEIDLVREVYEKKSIALKNEVEKAHRFEKMKNESFDEPGVLYDSEEAENLLIRLGYSSIEQPSVTEAKPKHTQVISPEEFGDLDYDVVSLTYYEDEVLTNDLDEVIGNIDGLVGLESLNHFGEYEDDSVFVRNDDLKTDFEILRDNRKYSDVVGDSCE